MKDIILCLLLSFLLCFLSHQAVAQGIRYVTPHISVEAIFLGAQYDVWDVPESKQPSLNGCLSAIFNDSPEYKARLSEFSLSAGAPWRWHWTAVHLEANASSMFRMPNLRPYEEGPDVLEPLRVSRSYYRGKLIFLDVAYDSPLFQDMRWLHGMLGKGISTKADIWRLQEGDGERVPKDFRVYGDALLGLGISSFKPDAQLADKSIPAFYTGLERSSELRLSLRYYGVFLQPFLRSRHIASQRALSVVSVGADGTVFLSKAVEIFAQYRKLYTTFQASSLQTIHAQAGLRYRIER